MANELSSKLLTNNSKLCSGRDKIVMNAGSVSLGNITTGDAVQWWRALHCIAREVKRFHNYHETKRIQGSVRSAKSDNMNKLNSVHFSLKTNNQILKKLKNNVTHAIDIARQVHVSKIKETLSLKKRLCLAKRDGVIRDQIMADLQSEAESLRNDLDTVCCIVDLAYNQLQEIRAEPTEALPVCEKLRQIILRCGEYYAAYKNEHDSLSKLEQRNRYLENKISIMNSQDATEKTVRAQKSIGKTDVSMVKKDIDNIRPATGRLSLKRHFSILGALVEDQENLIKLLADLASELNTFEK